MAGLLLLGTLVVAGTAGAHLEAGDPVHLDVEIGPYVSLEPLTFRLFASNPGSVTERYIWYSGCVLGGSIQTESRYIFLGPGDICTAQVTGIEVPANSTILWLVLSLETRSDDGCVRIDVYMNKYDEVSGSAEKCPGPVAPPPEAMILAVSSPAAAEAGETFTISATTRSLEGIAVEGVRIDVALGDKPIGSAITGPYGTASLSVTTPDVNETTTRSLFVQASAAGWRNASTARPMTIFPVTAPYLVVRKTLPTGDLVHEDGIAILEILLRGSDDEIPANASMDVEVEAPLSLVEATEVAPGRYRLTFHASPVNESRVAPVRVVANAPGYGGAELIVDFTVLAERASPPDDFEEDPSPNIVGPVLALGLLSAAAVIAAVAVLYLTRRRR